MKYPPVQNYIKADDKIEVTNCDLHLKNEWESERSKKLYLFGFVYC